MEEQSRLQKEPCYLGTSYDAMQYSVTSYQAYKTTHLLYSVGKLADAEYYTLCMPGGQGVQGFEANKVKVNISAAAVLQCWRD